MNALIYLKFYLFKYDCLIKKLSWSLTAYCASYMVLAPFTHLSLEKPWNYKGRGGKKLVFLPPCEADFFIHQQCESVIWVWLLIKGLPKLSNTESLSHTENRMAFMLLESWHIRGAHIIWLQRLNHVGNYHTQRHSSVNSLFGELEMTGTESMLAKMYLPLHCYPTTKATGLDAQTKKQENRQTCFTACVCSLLVIRFKHCQQAIFSG